jgi:hemerythrin-like domain-containing protein
MTARKTPTRRPKDAIALLIADHKKVQKMFKDFEKLGEEDQAQKGELCTQICAELKIHTMLEEEIFYPAMRVAIEEQDLLDEAEVEHASAKELISQLEGMKPGEDLFDAKVTVLGEYVNHHIKEEQNEIFPLAKKSEVDMVALGEELMERKQQLMREMGLAEGAQEEEQEEEEREER